jgi:hypothetical protein
VANVTKSGVSMPARQWAAVWKTRGAMSVPEQRMSRPGLSSSQSVRSAPTLGCRLPSGFPKVIAPAGLAASASGDERADEDDG